MGFLDFLKPKKDPPDPLTERNPRAKRLILAGMCEMVGKQAANLRAVGRKEEADQVIADYLKRVFQEFKNEPQDPRHLSLFTTVALNLGALETGRRTLESLIDENEKLSLDLTLVYTDLGRIYHQLRTDRKRELWCYEMAAEAKAPPGCRFPATRQQKAKAHHYAVLVASVLSLFNPEDPLWKIAEAHIKRTKELVPEVDWDNQAEVVKFFETQ